MKRSGMRAFASAAAACGVAGALGAGGIAGATARPQGVARAVSLRQTPAQILAQAEAATLSATSVTMKERILLDGKAVDATVMGRWPNRVRVVVATEGVVENLVVDARSVEIDQSALAWQTEYKVQPAAAAALAGHWYSTSRSDPALGGSIAALNPKALERVMFGLLARAAANMTVRPAHVAGRPALVLADSGGELYVAATGAPYALRMTSKLPTDHGFIQFSGYGASTRFAIPRATSLDTALNAAGAAAPVPTPTTVPLSATTTV